MPYQDIDQELLPPPPKKTKSLGEELLPPPPKKKENLGLNELPTPSDNGLSGTPKVEVVTDPITLSLQADELGRKVKSVGTTDFQLGAVSTTVPDEDAKKGAQLLKDEVKVKYGFDADELANEHKGLTPTDYGREGFSKEELLIDKKENPQLYQRKLGRLKWQSGFESVLADNLVNGNISKETYDGINHAIQSSLEHASIGDYVQQRDNINYVANAIKQYGGVNRDNLLKDYAVEVGKVYGNSYKSLSAQKKQETPESKFLNPDAELGLQYLKDIDPEKSQQYDRLFVDPKKLEGDALKGYNHLMQTLEETGIGLQDNAVTEDLNNLSNIAKRNDGLTPEQLEQAKVLETKKAEIEKKKIELDQKYPERIEDKVDDAVQEVLGQRLGWGSYAGGMAGKAIKNTGQGIWEAVSEPFMSDASNRMRELAIMGESLEESKVYHKTDVNKSFQTDQLMFKPELQEQVDLIKNDKSLTREQKEAKLYPLLKERKDDFGRVPIQGGQFNINPSSILYGVTDIGTTLLPFIGLEALTGGIGGAGTAAKFLRTFTAAAATSFHDEYANAISEGKPQSEAYKQAMGMTAITSAGMAGAGTAEKVRAFFSGSKSSAAKIIQGMSDDAIEKVLASNSNRFTKSYKVIKSIIDRAKETPKLFAQGLKTGAEFEGAMTLATEAKHQLYNTPIDREENFKHSILGIANFGILGAGLGQLGYKSPTVLQKSGFVEMGKNPEDFKLAAQQMLKDGQLTQAEFDHRKTLIDKSAEAVKTLPSANAKGKPLTEKQKADYIYNSVVKNEGKKAASNLPPKQAEKAEHTALVADFKNDLILEPKTDAQLESRENALEKVLGPKKDADGKTIELNEKVEKEAKAELQAINETIKEHKAPILASEPEQISQPIELSTEITKPQPEVKSEKDIRREEFKNAKQYEFTDTETGVKYKANVVEHADGSRTIEILNQKLDNRFGGQMIKVSKDFKGTNEEAINKHFAIDADVKKIEPIKPQPEVIEPSTEVKSEEGKGVTDEKLLNNPTPNKILENIDDYSKSQLRSILEQNDKNGDYGELSYDELKEAIKNLFNGEDFDAMSRQVKVSWLNIPKTTDAKIVEGGFVKKAQNEDIAKIEKYSGMKVQEGTLFQDAEGNKYRITEVSENGISIESLNDNENNIFNGKNTIKYSNQNLHGIFYKDITPKSENKPIQKTEEVSPEIKKLEQERDTKIKELEKVEVPKLEYVKEDDLVKMKNETELIEEQRDIKKREGQLKSLIKCLTGL